MDRYQALLEEYISLHGEMDNITARFGDFDKSWRPEMKTFMNSKQVLDLMDAAEQRVQRVSDELQLHHHVL